MLASHDSIKQARSQLDRIPGLALCVRNVDLSNASCRWSEQKVSERCESTKEDRIEVG